MGYRLTIVVDLPHHRPSVDDPDEVAELVMSDPWAVGDPDKATLVRAQWGDRVMGTAYAPDDEPTAPTDSDDNPAMPYEIRFEASAHPEIDALRAVNQAIADLPDPEARQRVAAWAYDRHGGDTDV